VTFAKLQKLLKGATKAIANAKIQHSTNAELIAAKETQKRCNKRSKKNYGFARVMDAELIEEREAEYKAQTFKEVWKDLLRVKPWVRAKKTNKKKSLPSKPKARDKADHQLIEQLSPTTLQFLQPELRSPVKTTSPVKSTDKAEPRKALVAKKVPVKEAAGRAVKDRAGKSTSLVKTTSIPTPQRRTIRRAAGRAAERAAGCAAAQAEEQLPKEQVRQTQSGRISVKRVIFEAGRN
jgi:hypothetical protein